ncbi:unnamed protein product [Sympodiomycopsis kandeliae]
MHSTTANAQMHDLALTAGLPRTGTLYTFRRGAASTWSESLGPEYAKQLLGHGLAKETAARRYTRTVHEYINLTELTTPAVPAYAITKESGQGQQAKSTPRIEVDLADVDEACDQDTKCQQAFALFHNAIMDLVTLGAVTLSPGCGYRQFDGLNLAEDIAAKYPAQATKIRNARALRQ